MHIGTACDRRQGKDCHTAHVHVVYRGGLCGEIKVDLRGSNGETASVNDDASMLANLACKTCTGGFCKAFDDLVLAPQVPE